MDPISNFFLKKLVEKAVEKVYEPYNLVKNAKAERFQWKPVTCAKSIGGNLGESEFKTCYKTEDREPILNWIRQHVRYKKSTIFNRSPAHVKHVRAWYEKSGIGYLSTTDMADALIEAGFFPVGSDQVGWYFEVEVVD